MLDLNLHPVIQLHLLPPPVSSLSRSIRTILCDWAVSDLLTPYLLTSTLDVGKNTMIEIHRTKGHRESCVSISECEYTYVSSVLSVYFLRHGPVHVYCVLYI